MEASSLYKRWSGYIPILPYSTDVAGAKEEQARDEGNDAGTRRSKTSVWLTAVNVVLFLLTATMWYLQGGPRTKALNAALRETSSYTPIFDMIDLEPSIKKINGTVKPAGQPSIARQFPNAAADERWEEDIELIRPIPVTREQIIKMGKNPDTVAKLEDHIWGLGDNAYVAALDLFHNLHCLNSLRQAAYGNYYNQTMATTSISSPDIGPRVQSIHFQTCASINAHCINFDKLVKWHKEASVDMEKYVEVMKKPKGVKEEPAETWQTGP
ncbi:hypothetical protein Purlil1_12591 [Purpureocillium lilacinum]|uniref:Tat pathway signal sequence n=1 Tax=Purpureocillium lilacinum TaxID=33203 RepID=A0ABR0BGH1_PURLI|nr:hypothetical protein Purlil1_12591 [Purpureocillium lilacinum]